MTQVKAGMTHPVIAGTLHEITDIKGESLLIEGRDDPLTINFIQAYDEYLLLRRTMSDGNIALMAAAAKLDMAFEALPRRIKDVLPSRKAGILIPGRG